MGILNEVGAAYIDTKFPTPHAKAPENYHDRIPERSRVDDIPEPKAQTNAGFKG